jgi:hypothetical protein
MIYSLFIEGKIFRYSYLFIGFEYYMDIISNYYLLFNINKIIVYIFEACVYIRLI